MGAAGSFRASLGAAAALHRHRDCLAPAVAYHAAAAIGPAIPAAPLWLLAPRGQVPLGVFRHRTPGDRLHPQCHRADQASPPMTLAGLMMRGEREGWARGWGGNCCGRVAADSAVPNGNP